MAVIELARLVVDETVYNDLTDRFEVPDDQYHLLEEAVMRLQALGLEPATKTRTSRGAPVTSHMAAAYMHGKYVDTLVGWIVRRLYHSPGLTCDDLERDSGRSHQSVSPRLNELRDNGWIIDTGHTRPTRRSGQEATVWCLSTQARSLMNQESDAHG